jgi:hypothetical protein
MEMKPSQNKMEYALGEITIGEKMASVLQA